MPHILVVEDEAIIAMMIGEWLTELDCEAVGPAASVCAALDLLSSTIVQAAILDLSLAGEESYAVADALQAKGVPFAFATGHGSGGIAPNYVHVPVLTKPFNFGNLRDTLKILLDASA